MRRARQVDDIVEVNTPSNNLEELGSRRAAPTAKPRRIAMEDLEGLSGFKRTKGGSNQTEPALIVCVNEISIPSSVHFLAVLVSGQVWSS